jgi:hypothetical protein
MAFLIFVHPYAFTGFDHTTKVLRFLTIFFFNALFPAFAVFLLWRLKLFVHSIHLHTVKERIIPYLIAMIFYWWTWNVYKNLDMPAVATRFLLGSFLAVCGAWMCNIYFKISMHAVAVGGALMLFLLYSFNDDYASGLYLSVAFLITGIVCTARFICSDHTAFQVYSGLFIGLLAQFIAWQF